MLAEVLRYFTTRNPAELGRDLLDVAIVYYIFYRIALVLKGTRAMQVGVGLVGVFVLYVVAQLLQLHTVLTLLGAVLSSAILIGVVVFQNDIRRGLMRVGAGARFGTGQNLKGKVLDDVVEAANILARHRIGAIITLEQDANLDEFVGSHTGHRLDAAVSQELLVSLFIPEGLNKLHDGAVVIRDLRIAKAGVFFPMPEGRVKDESFGSRHRAAMGITEETDAVVIVVSEERGSVSFCFNGNIVPNLDGAKLRAAIEVVFVPKRVRKAGSWFARWFRRKGDQDRISVMPLSGRKSVLDTGVGAGAGPERISLLPAPPSSAEAPSREVETAQPLRKRTYVSDDDLMRASEAGAAPEPLRKRQSLVHAEPEREASKLRSEISEKADKPTRPERAEEADRNAPAPLRRNLEKTAPRKTTLLAEEETPAETRRTRDAASTTEAERKESEHRMPRTEEGSKRSDDNPPREERSS
jgi:diadenylate cyclase